MKQDSNSFQPSSYDAKKISTCVQQAFEGPQLSEETVGWILAAGGGQSLSSNKDRELRSSGTYYLRVGFLTMLVIVATGFSRSIS